MERNPVPERRKLRAPIQVAVQEQVPHLVRKRETVARLHFLTLAQVDVDGPSVVREPALNLKIAIEIGQRNDIEAEIELDDLLDRHRRLERSMMLGQETLRQRFEVFRTNESWRHAATPSSRGLPRGALGSLDPAREADQRFLRQLLSL